VTNPRIGPVVRATARPWEDWLRFMDSIGAQQLRQLWADTLTRFLRRA
jgi:hypothetical protein